MNTQVNTVPYARIRPQASLALLSHEEIDGLLNATDEVFQLFNEVALAILNTDSQEDDASELVASYPDFQIRLVPQSRGLYLEVRNAPARAFVDGRMIRGVQDQLFEALRDIVFTYREIERGQFNFAESEGITDAVFRILRNAQVVRQGIHVNLVVCWGGHSISRPEYDFSKKVGYEMGLRGLDVATGCGVGAMKGPMKGAAVGHAKQQIKDGRYIGITEPGIIASESPNPIVNELVIMPDIEKRLEAFVRLAHCIVVFPGGVGTAEEVLYLLSILMHPENTHAIKLIFAADHDSADYFDTLEGFLVRTLGESVTQYYERVIGDPARVARLARASVDKIRKSRHRLQQSYAFDWELKIDYSLQQPFIPTHEAMAGLRFGDELAPHELASQLRCAFSGIVAGNVKRFGIEQVARHGPYCLHMDREMAGEMDKLLNAFIEQKRMKLTRLYQPCYQVVSANRSAVVN